MKQGRCAVVVPTREADRNGLQTATPARRGANTAVFFAGRNGKESVTVALMSSKNSARRSTNSELFFFQ
jgi:hypothetical protein